MANPNDNLYRLYQNGLKHFSLPDFDTFKQDMMDEQKRRRFYTNMQEAYSLPDFDTFSKDIGAVQTQTQTQAPATMQPATPTTVDTTPQQATSVQTAAQPTGWQPTAVQRAAFQHQMDEMNASWDKMRTDFQTRMEGIKKGGRLDASLGTREFNPQTGKTETVYYTRQGDRVGTRMEQSQRNTAYNEWWETNTEEGKRSREQRLQREYDDRLSHLWSKHDPSTQGGMNAAERAWNTAESAYNAAAEKNRQAADFNTMAFAMNSSDAVAFKQLEQIDNYTDRLTTHDITTLMDNAWANLGEETQNALIEDCFNILRYRYPGADELELHRGAEQLARQQSDLRMYNLAVANNVPRSKLEFFMRKVQDGNLVMSIGKGIAHARTGKDGDVAAYEQAMGTYASDHKVLNIAGMVTGFVADPTTWMSAGVGGAAAKGTLWGLGRYAAGRGATAAMTNAAVRQVSTTLGGRVVAGVVGGAVNFGTFEAIKEAENQFVHGGEVIAADENDDYRTQIIGYKVGDYSAGAIAKQGGHGMLMGAAIGWLGPVSGNVSDKLVRATASTAGKAAIRTGTFVGSTMAEGTIFSVPEWISDERDAYDVWTDNMAMMVGFKVQHGLKSAPHTIAEFGRTADGRRGMASRIREYLDRPSDGGMALTKDEKAELQEYGYDLNEMVRDAGDPTDAALVEARQEALPSKLTEMVTDPRLSEAVRAKMYYYATGRRLPMSTIMRGELLDDGNGGFIVQSHGANGVITSRGFKNRKAADLELERINRQAELNKVDLGEKYQQTEDFEKRLQDACRKVADENGWNAVDVYRLCSEARRDYKKGVSKEYDEAMQGVLNKVVEALGEYKEGDVTDAMRSRINEQYGVDIDKALAKEAKHRTEAEQAAIEQYIKELIPEKANEVSDVDAEDLTDQKLLGEEGEPIDPRFEGVADDNGFRFSAEDIDTWQNQQPIGRAVMKYQDRPVEVLSGRVVMMEDGTMVDNERSDASIIIRDLATGAIEMVSPEAILSYEEYKMNADAETAQPAAEQEAAAAEAPAEQPKYTSGQIKIRNSDGTETRGVLTGFIDDDGKHEYYVEGDLQHLHYATDNELDLILSDYQPDEQPITPTPEASTTVEAPAEQPITPTPEASTTGEVAMPDGIAAVATVDVAGRGGSTRRFTVGKNAEGENVVLDESGFMWGHDGNGGNMQPHRPGANMPTWSDEQIAALGNVQPINLEPTAVPNTPESVPNSAENTENSVNFAENPAESVPNEGAAAPSVEPQPTQPQPIEAPAENVAEQTPLQRIPRDEKGNPIFEQADSPETAWDALVEYSEGDAGTAKEIADAMAEKKKKDFEKAQKLKLKGNSPAEMLASKKANAAELAKAQAEYEHWQKMAGVEQSRQAAIRSQHEAEARRLAAERAEAEKAEREAREEAARLEREALEGIPEWHLDTPENARKRGVRRFSGQMFTRQEPVQGVVGKEVEVKFSQKDLPKGRVAVIEASQLQPSHVQGQRNPMFFIDEAQPKNRAEAVSAFAAQEMAEGIRPQEITGSATAYTGAPTVNTRGEVIQGNNRSDALRYLWENKLPEQQQTYKQYLIDNAEQFGLDPEAVNAMQQPVLVNMLDVDDAEAIRLGQMTAQDTESGGIERIKPKNVAQKLGEDMRSFASQLLRSGDEEASFSQLVDRNGTEVMKWMAQKGAITNTQYQSAFDSKGNLTAEAKNDLQKVLYQAVFKGGSQQLEEMFDALPAKAQRAILSTAFRDMDSPFAGKMLPEIQSSIAAFNQLMNDPTFAAAKKMEEVMRAIDTFKRTIALDDRFEQVMPADNFSNFALHLAAMYKATDFSQTTIASYFNQMYDLAQGKKAATLFEEADTTEYPLAEVIKRVLNIEYQPAKNGNNNVANGGADVALRNQVSQGGELRGTEPPASGEQTPAGTEPSDSGAGAAGNSGGDRASQEDRGSQSPNEQQQIVGRTLSTDEAINLIARMENGAEVAPDIELTPENWRSQFGEKGLVKTPLGEVKMGDHQYIKLADKKRQGYFGMVKPTLENPDIVLEELDSKEGADRDTKMLFVKTFVKADGSRVVHFESVTVQQGSMEVSISSHEVKATPLAKKMQNDKVLHLNERLLNSDGRLIEPQSEGSDLVPTPSRVSSETTAKTEPQQPNNAVSSDSSLSAGEQSGTSSTEPNGESTVSKRKDSQSLSNEQANPEESSLQPADSENNKPLTQAEMATINQEAFFNAVASIEDGIKKGGIPNVAAIKKQIADRKRRLSTLEKGAATGITDDATLRKHQTAVATLQGEIDGLQAELDSINKRIKESEQQSVQSAVEAANAEVNTNPTPAQAEAGNYKHGYVTIGDFNIKIENPAGSVRKGTDANGKAWETKMANTYGEIQGTESTDGDALDVFLAGDMDEWNGRKVFIVDQTNPDGSFDEHKVMLGFNDKDEAMAAYLANYDDTWAQTHPGLRISEANIEDFNKWVDSSHRKTKPFADYSTVSKITDNAPTEAGASIQGNGYSVTSKPYTNKQGKTLDTYLVSFGRDFSKEEMSALRAKAKALKGWYDRDAKGWMLRSVDDAKAFAEDVVGKSEDEVADEAPLSMADMQPTTEYKVGDVVELNSGEQFVIRGVNPTTGAMHGRYIQSKKYGNETSGLLPKHIKRIVKRAGDKPKADKPAVTEVDVMGLMGAVRTATEQTRKDGKPREVKLSDHAKPVDDEFDPKYSQKGRTLRQSLKEIGSGELAFVDLVVGESYKRTNGSTITIQSIRGNEVTYTDGKRTFSNPALDVIATLATTPPEPPKPKKKSKWISDEDAAEFDSLRDGLRNHFGKGNDMVQEEGATYGKPQPKQMDAEVLRMGTRMTYLMMKGGLRSFADYCEAMKDELPDIFDDMRPHLKSLYAAAQNMEEVMQLGWDEEMDDRKTVKAFDVYNFDKPGAKDIIATAQHTVDEQASQQQTDQIIQSLKDQRNEQRKKEADETSADTKTIIDKAEATASQVESKLEAANSEQDAERLAAELDKEIEEVNKQLALLGYYEADPVDKDFNEAYGYMRNAERKAVQDAHRLATQLAADLGITIDPKDKVRKAKYGFGSKIARSNVAPAGGEVYITLPLAEGRELSIWLSLDKNEPWRDGGREDRTNEDLMLTGIMYRVENPNGKGHDERYVSSNHNIKPEATYDELLAAVRRLVRTYLPDEPVRPAEALTPQPGEDMVQVAARVAKDSEPKQPTVKPEQTMGDLFGGLFDMEDEAPATQPTTTKQPTKPKANEKTDVQPRSEEAGRGRQQPRPNEPLGESAGHEAERTDGGGMAERGGVHTVPDTKRSAGVSGQHQSERSVAQPKNTRNNHAERGVDYAPKGEKARIDANLAAVELAKKLLASGATATPQEMAILRRYSGWGGLGAAFKEGDRWAPNPINKRLREMLTPEEYEAAVMSRNSAYYTPAPVIDAMWDIAKALGFKGGNIVEGSAGIGNIIGLMPTDISERSNIHAVEIDNTTGGILSLLYPDAKVEVQGFEQTRIPNGSVDLAITNVPFVTGLHVMDETGDSDLSKKFRDIHDFCIAKNVRKLREGGIGIFITSSGTLDKSQKLRNWLVGDKEGCADVVGVFRMNNQTFGGTAATSDIIVVRKRVNGRRSANAIDVSTVSAARTAAYTDDKGKTKDLPILINRYFIEHPEYMGGEMFFGFEQGDTYRPTSMGLFPTRTADQAGRMAAWVQHLSDMDWSKEQGTAVAEQTSHINEALGEGVKEGSMVTDSEGNLCVARMGRAVPLSINKNKIKGRTKQECFKDYTEIKNALAEVLKYQTEHEDDAGLQPLIDRLNKAYDTFVARYGNLNKNSNLAWLRNDVDFSSIVALETYSEKGDKDGKKIKTYGKTDIFSRRVVDKETEPAPKNVKDGIIASLYKFGRIDPEYLATQLGKSKAEVKPEIIESGLGFEDPNTGQMEVSYEYLSGNVREKLREAREANEATGGTYAANVRALEAVLPLNIPAHLIEFTLGSSWVDPKLYERFIKERTELDVHLTNAGGTWHMSEPYFTDKPKNKEMGIRSETLNVFIPGHKLIEAAITNKTITVSKTFKDYDGSSHTETDPLATAACAAKVDEIRQDFKDWAREQMQNDPDLSMRMEQIYNEQFNNSVPKSIPDEFVPEHFGGAATVVGGRPFRLRPHQAKAVIRATTQPVLLAHEVGTGKTYTLITTAMEMRRLGTARKPMIVVQNATVGQFVASAKALYPNAKILTLEDADRNAEGRRAFYAKIKFNDWDMIVVPQSVLERIPDSVERQTQFIQEKIEEKLLVLEQMKDADPSGKSMIVRAAEREINNLENEIAQLASGGVSDKKKEKDAKKAAVTRQNAEVKAREMLDRETDDVEDFDSMGIDAILIDEAHEYKHLGFATAMQRGVKGVDPTPSKKSQGVFLKVQSVLEKTGGKNVVFATGTPISNTAAEIWTFMRYLIPADVMKEYDIFYFDDFVRNFGNIQQMLEFKTNGKYKENNRFAGYVNLPELVRIWSTVADTVLTREAGGVSDKIPAMEGGKAQDKFLPQTRALRSIMKYVKQQLDEYDKMSGKEKKENSHIPLVMYGIAKAAAVDARLVQRDAADDPDSKTNEAVRQTLRSLEETKDYKGTVAIFADNYQNKASGFNLYEDIRKKLIAAGVPEEQVVVMKSEMTVKKKLEIFDRVNAGEVRVVMGSTFTLGTGVNIQERLHTLIHLDAPNRPMDYTQRNGRILRQGNLHKEWGKPVRVLRFGVEDSLDVTAYQRLKTKGAIADSIMNGKQLMENSMDSRSLEEEQDLFGDITAQLSGSEYALLKNQIEKEVRKLTAKLKAWEADQTYIHNRKRQIAGQNKDAEKRIADNKGYLEKVEAATIGNITVGKRTFPSMEAMEDFFTEQNKKKAELQEQVRNGGYTTRATTTDIVINIGGFDFHVHTEINYETKRGQQGDLFAAAPAKMTYSCAELGIENMPVKENRIKNAVAEILEDVVSGEDFRGRIEAAQRSIERNNAELESMAKRDGVPFQFSDELAKAEEKLAEYEELMKKEMEAKEAKYADMDKDVEAAADIELTEEDSEDDVASEPGAEYSSENRNFASRYKTKDGKTISYTSENPEAYGVPGTEDGTARGRINRRQQSEPTLQRKNAALLERASDRLNEAEGEYCAIERVFRESGYMDFTSAQKVKSADDVAFIFEELENASVENVFVVMTKRGVPTVLHISIGGFNWSAMNAAAVKNAFDRIQPDKVYFVHNHPSGVLKCSDPDIKCLKQVEGATGIPALGVIINLKSGKYGTFDSSGTWSSESHDKAPAPTAQRRLRLYAFDRHVFNPDYQPSEAIRSSEDVAKFLSSHRLGDRSKVSVLVCNNQNQIVANVHTTHVRLDSEGLANDVVRAIGDFGGMRAFLYGDFDLAKGADYRSLKEAIQKRSGGVYDLLDVMHIEGNRTISASDQGLMWEPGSEYGADKNGDLRFREVDDDKVLTEFAEGKTVKAYRTMQVIDGKLYSPMATKVGGKSTPEIKLGVPEQSEEHPEIIKGTKVGRDGIEQGYVVIDKGLGKGTLTVAYNPYAHTSRTVLNDQFSSAYIRPNLVTVEVEVPESELTSGYRAHLAKDAVGEMAWHSGSVSGQLADLGKPRRVILTRYDRPVRIVPFKEVAQMIADQLDGTDIAIPYNVVQPQLRAELERLGVTISEEATGSVGEEPDFGKAEYITDQEIERINASEAEKRQTSPEAKQEYAERLSKKFNTPIRIVTDVNELTHENPEIQAAMRRHKGFYDVRTGEVVVVVPNNADVEDVAESVFHEVVAHKGLREMIGEDNYDAFCDEIYDHLEDELKQKIDEETTRRFMNDPAKGHDYHRRVAVDEMFGRMSEKGFEDFTKAERGLWKKLKKKVLEAINKFLGSLKLPKWVKLGDNELRYILWRSHERLRSKGDYVDMARDAVKREELGLNDKTKPEPTESEKRARAMSRSKREFESTRDRAIREKGIVTPGLNDGEVRIVRVGQHPFSGDKPIKQAEAWAKAHLVGLHTATDSRGEEFEYSISKNKVEKQLSVSAVGRSENLGVHLAALTKLPEIISESIEAEIHPDYKKGADGQRKPENGVNNAALIHRFYGAAEIDGKIYRVKTTMEEFVDDNRPNTPHSFEVTKIELLEAPSASTDNGSGQPLAMTSNNSNGVQENASSIRNGALGTTKLLENVEKSYDAGKKLLDESGLAEEPTYEYRFRDGETGDIWNDQSIGFEERITNAAIRLSNNQSGDLTLRNDAMRAIGGNLTSLRRAMAAQKRYDQATVKRVTDLARILMQGGYLSGMTSGEMQRLLSVVKNATAMHDIADSVQKIMDIMVNNQLRNGEATLRQLLAIRGSKVDARGVEVQGALDVEGQRTMEVVKKAMSLSEEDINDRIAEALNRMSDPYNTIADQAAIEYAGLNMALDYVQNIANSKAEEKALRDGLKTAKEDKDAGRMTADAYKQFVEATEDAIRKNKIERAEAYNALVGRLSDSMRQSIENAKAWREAEKRRIQEIQHNANSDMQGMPSEMHRGKDTWKDGAANLVAATAFAPLATFEQMIRGIAGQKAADGEGYLYNRFVRGLNDARAKEISGYRGKQKKLDEKAKEIFSGSKHKVKSWGDVIRLERKLPKMRVTYFDKSANEMKDAELMQGNLLYIYMVDKMSDGRMKLRKMGITEDDVQAIADFLDPRIKALGDWLQEEFLVETRNEYNETHKRMFGTSMAAIENYFPLKILGDARGIKEDIDAQDTIYGATSTVTGAIKKRKVNTLALDILGADAFNVMLDHLAEMEHWNAYAEIGRDMNALLSYGKFRNRVKNMRTIYGAGDQLWKRFKDVSRIAFGTYHQEVNDFDEGFLKIARGVTAAKVAFRLNTALKQTLSLPAMIPDMSISGLIEGLKNPRNPFTWCMENLPVFEERWRSRISGDPRLMKSERGWNDWRNNVVEIAGRWGMTPNAFIDAVICSIVAKTIYDTKLSQYIKDGYEQTEAEARAKQDASIGYNLSQQSSEGAYLAPIQAKKNWLSVMFTVFRNSPMSYTRQVFDSVRNLKRNLTPGKHAEQIEYMTKQTLREWQIDPDNATDQERTKAKERANRRYSRSLMRDALRLLTYGFVLPGLWSLGGYWLYMLLGNDEEEKQQMKDDIYARLSTAPFEGLTGGDVLSNVASGYLNGTWNENTMTKDMPLSADITQIAKKLFKEDKTADGINDIFNLCIQSGFGFNPATIENAVLGIMDACGNDVQLANEATIVAARILNCPESQVKKLYFDEIGMSGEEASKLSPAEIAERYARMQIKLGRPIMPWLWNDEAAIDKRMNGRYGTLTTAKERFERQGDGEVKEAYAGYKERHDAIDEKVKAAKKLMQTDYVAAAQMMAEVQSDSDFTLYQQFHTLDKQLTTLAGMWIKSKSGGEAAVIATAVNDYRAAMVKVLGATSFAEQQAAMQELQGVMQRFNTDYTTYKPQPKQLNR